MRSVRILVLGFIVVLAACGSSGSKTKTTATTTASSTATSAAAAAGANVNVGQTGLGAVLVNSQGRTLYHLTTESATKITCTGPCASTWPPLVVASGQQPQAGAGVTGTLTAVDRPDGTKQAAFNGQPLYTYSGDSKTGDTNGEGIGGVWHVIKISAAGGAGATPAVTSPTTVARVTTTAGGSYGGGGY
jgi:predicted lipoprotein with Yx(FWY)xxD motif